MAASARRDAGARGRRTRGGRQATPREDGIAVRLRSSGRIRYSGVVNILVVLAFLVAWIVIQTWLLPRLGVPT